MKDRDLVSDEPSLQRKEWATPQLSRMIAGLAEFGDFSQADTQPGFS